MSARLFSPWDSPGKTIRMPSSRGSSQPRDWTQVSCTAGRFFTIWATREAHFYFKHFNFIICKMGIIIASTSFGHWVCYMHWWKVKLANTKGYVCYHLLLLGWSESSFRFSITSYWEIWTNFLANPVFLMISLLCVAVSLFIYLNPLLLNVWDFFFFLQLLCQK